MDKTIQFFYEISQIPRESGNEQKISEYLCEFAKKRNLPFEKDEYNNVIIKKKNSEKLPIILQSHMDMVCEKDIDKVIDFETDPIEVYEEEGYLKAKGTTLGADNGIGVAQILNILDSNIKCNIEAIFTVSEETTMIGAQKINLSDIKSKQMISLDGFDKNTIIIESASFFDIILEHEYDFKSIKEDNIYKIELSGLDGGHSGFDINKNRGNASIELASLLKKIDNIKLISFTGGTKFNVIPSLAESKFSSKESEDSIKEHIINFLRDRKTKYKSISIRLEKINSKKEYEGLNNENSLNFLDTINNFKHGVYKENNKKEVTTSINLGVVDLKDRTFKIGMRSSKENEKTECLKYIENYSLENKLKFKILSSQPFFETDENSEFITKLKNAFEKVNNQEELNIKSVHITVEAGLFKDKIKDLQVAIISPEIQNAHTIKECVNLESIEKCDRWLKEFLES